MNIIFLSPFFFPEEISTGKYNTFLVEGLYRRGHNVTVISSHPIYPEWKTKKTDALISGIEIIRGSPMIQFPKSSILRRALLEFWYAIYSTRMILKCRSNKDLVISVFPPGLFFLCIYVLLPKRLPKVSIVHDLQDIYATGNKSIFNLIVRGFIRFIEGKSFSLSDKLIFLSNSMSKKAQESYGISKFKCSVRYPFINVDYHPVSSNHLDDIFQKNAFNVVYSGALGEKQNPLGLFNFLNKLAGDQSGANCYIFSAGPYFEELKERYANRLDCFVRFYDLVPSDFLSELYFRSDVQIVPQLFNTGDSSLPSKLPNLLSAGVPVFAICDESSEIGELLKKVKFSFVANTWDECALYELFCEFKQEILCDKSKNRRNIKSFLEANFSIDSLMDSILSGYEDNE